MRFLLKSAVPLALLLAIGQSAVSAETPVRPRLEDFSSYAEFLNAMTAYQRKLRGVKEEEPASDSGSTSRPANGTVSDLDLATIQAAGKKVELTENAGLATLVSTEPAPRATEDLERAIEGAQQPASTDTELENGPKQADTTELASLVVEGALESTAAVAEKTPVTELQKDVDDSEQGDQPKRQSRNNNGKKKGLFEVKEAATATRSSSVGSNGAMIGATFRPNASISVQVRN